MSQLSQQIETIATQYLGPAARKFLERQTITHMNGLSFDSIAQGHLAELAKWVEISAGLVIDKASAAELAGKIKTLH
jgi:hypothetical protein